MRRYPLLALSAILLLAPLAHGRETTELRERVRDGVQRTDKDLGNLVHREKLNDEQRGKFDAAVKDLEQLQEAITNGKWESERARFEHAIENIDFLDKNAPMSDADRQSLGIDVYTLKVILDSWKP